MNTFQCVEIYDINVYYNNLHFNENFFSHYSEDKLLWILSANELITKIISELKKLKCDVWIKG